MKISSVLCERDEAIKSNQKSCRVASYLDGEHAGVLIDRPSSLTFPLKEVILRVQLSGLMTIPASGFVLLEELAFIYFLHLPVRAISTAVLRKNAV